MASRVEALGAMAVRVRPVEFVNANVRGGIAVPELNGVIQPYMVDAAVAEVTQDLDESQKRALSFLWATETSGPLADAVQTARMAAHPFSKTARKHASVRSVMTAVEADALADAYPEYRLDFKNSEQHDHALAAEVRKLDYVDVLSEFAPGCRYVDVGGKAEYHVMRGDVDCKVLSPNLDPHDPQRETLSRLRLQRIASDPGSGVLQRGMAEAVLMGTGRYHSTERLEDFSEPMRAGVANQVWDLPMKTVAAAMERCGMQVFYHVTHLTRAMLVEPVGDVPVINARYTIENNRLSMGFKGSGAKWYTHDWAELRKYLSDQLVAGSRTWYAYKVVKRRACTQVGRFIPVGPLVVRELRQCFQVPGVDAVTVNGFVLSSLGARRAAVSDSHLTRKTFVFPKGTWSRMVRGAVLDALRDKMSNHEMVNRYRTIVAQHTFGGVLAGEAVVHMSDLPYLVVFSSIYALTQVAYLKGQSTAFVQAELASRTQGENSLATVVLKALVTVVKSLVTVPVRLLCEWLEFLSGLKGNALLHKLIEVRDAVKFAYVPAEMFSGTVSAVVDDYDVAEYPFKEYLRANADFFESYKKQQADAMAAQCKAVEQRAVVEDAEDGVIKSSLVPGSTTCVGEELDTGRPDWLPWNGGFPEGAEVYKRNDKAHSPGIRIAAVQEALDAAEEEWRSLEAAMRMQYAEAMVNGSPSQEVLTRKKGAWFEPTMWYVEGGVILRSSTGKPPTDFEYGGVYCPVMRDATSGTVRGSVGQEMRSVRLMTRKWQAERECVTVGSTVELDGDDFTGWVLASDKTVVYNGPEIVTALRTALEQTENFGFEGGARIGGPGCGKTTTIRKSYTRGQMVCSPLVKSVRDMRKVFLESGMMTEAEARMLARTVDSLLVFMARKGVEQARGLLGVIESLVVDEGYTTLAGRIYALAALLGVERLIVYGDPKQIPPVVRAARFVLYKQVELLHEVWFYIVFRGTPVVLATFNSRYEYKLRSVKTDEDTGVLIYADINTAVKAVKPGSVLDLCMYQAGKKEMRAYGVDCITTHEGQGSDVDVVKIYMPDARPRADGFDLYESEAYVCTALSRAKNWIVLGLPRPNTMLEKFAARGKNRMHVLKCGELATAGTDYTSLPGWRE